MTVGRVLGSWRPPPLVLRERVPMEKATWLAPWTGLGAWDDMRIDGSMRSLHAQTDGAVRTHATHDRAQWFRNLLAFTLAQRP